MTHSDFRKGERFRSATGEWICTDIGTRVIVAIRVESLDPSWYNGPPYAVVETVFDENDMPGCWRGDDVR